MPLMRFKHENGFDEYVFEGEEHRLKDSVNKYTKMPPRPTVVFTTIGMMVEYVLDSVHTAHELDRQLNIEEREQKELKVFQEARKNF